MKRFLDICVISDVHLGTYGCHAEELLRYLRSIRPKCLIINGDFIDAWQFKKKYFPRPHLEVIQHVLRMAIDGTKVYYLTGNHDDILRKFSEISMGQMHLKDKLVLQFQGRKYWFFHGDIFDASVLISPLLAKIGGKGYDWLIRINRFVNHLRFRMGKPRVSFAHQVKAQVKRAVKYVSDFERTAVRHAVRQGFDYVVCGHIHKPAIEAREFEQGSVIYMNSGDWIENLSALECKNGNWNLFFYETSDLARKPVREGTTGTVRSLKEKPVPGEQFQLSRFFPFW